MIEYIKNISIPIVLNSTDDIDLAIQSLTSAISSALNNAINPSETKITNKKHLGGTKNFVPSDTKSERHKRHVKETCNF